MAAENLNVVCQYGIIAAIEAKFLGFDFKLLL